MSLRPRLFFPRELHVLVVCTANVCRSPAAAALLRHHLKHLDVNRRVAVRSAGTQVGMPGAPADPRMVGMAAELGVRLKGHRAVSVDVSLIDRSDRIWVMEDAHIHAVLDRFPDAADRVALIYPAGDAIADPYFGDTAGVREAFEQLDLLCRLRAVELVHASC